MNVFKNNREKLINLMTPNSVLLLQSGRAPHKTTDQFYHYTPQRNFYYLTGLEEENVTLLIYKGTKDIFSFLFIEETTDFMRKWIGERISKEEASEISGIEVGKIRYLKNFDTFFKGIMMYFRGNSVSPPENLYLDLYRYDAKIPPVALSQFSNITRNYKELKVKNVNKYLSILRMYKAPYEIENTKNAIEITRIGLERVMNSIPSRSNEYQVEADFIHEITLQGSPGKSFNIIAASGENATVLHYEDNDDKLNKGELLLLDLGVNYNNYASDISRTYPINGKFTDRQKAIYEVVLETNKKCIEFVKPGISWKELNDYAKSLLTQGLKNLKVINKDEDLSKYYYHGIGHFLGLDVHDIGLQSMLLKEGMLLTIEPGLYIKEERIGIRIEDNILVTKDGSENLSKDIIKEVKDIEAFMQK